MENINDIISILMRRDNITENEAQNIVNECIDELSEAIMHGNYSEAEDIVASYLSLEPDYLDILLNELIWR